MTALPQNRVSYASGTSDVPLLGMTIGEKFDAIVAEFGLRPAIVSVHQQLRMTYQELGVAVDTLARALIACGLGKGDRIGIWSPNNVEWLITQYASAKVGAILVTINPAYRVHELAYVLQQSGCKMLVLQNQFKTSDYEAMVVELCPALTTCEAGELVSIKFPDLTTVISLSTSVHPGILDWQTLLDQEALVSAQMLRVCQAAQDMDDAINIQYTSGTTGFPKGACLSHHNILNNGYFVARTMKFSADDRLVVPVPLYHCFGMVMANLGCLTHAACLIYPSESFEPQAVLQAVQSEAATALFGVPTMFIAELALPTFGDYDLSSLRTGVMAGAPCPVAIMQQVNTLMHMTQVEIAYGMTETSPVSFQTRTDSPLDKRVSTVGLVHPHVEVKVIDQETGLICAIDTLGELCTRGYSVMAGYWQNPEATATAIDAQGWMHTGDIAIMDADGYVNIVGRIKDMIVRGGENVYPREVEEFLITHPAINAVQVTGVPDARYGEEIIAWVALEIGQTLTDEDIKIYCRETIAHYKVPRYIRFTDDFPMTVTGKVQKFKMREISMQELGLVDQQMA
jgi:fatty-acyl-CoA synthase